MTDPVSRLNDALTGRYRVERDIGEGGMATVYVAHDTRHERRVAIKVLRPELAAVVGADRFLAEVKTTANLQHPHILPLFDSGEADGFLFYVMPFVAGESLRERLGRERQLPIGESVQITRAVASALDYAHREGVIHRDVKPANILLHDGQPLVADFGIALALFGATDRLTATGMSVGTPQYMSPEQASGDQAIGPTADVYALGCVLYEMLTGEPPHTGATPQAVLGKLLSDRPASVRRARETVPANVDAAVLTALAKTPADRFASAAQFANALADPTFRRPGSDGDVEPAYPARKIWTRAAILGWGFAAIATVLAVWGWFRSSQPQSSLPVLRYSTPMTGTAAEVDQFYSTLALSPDGQTVAFVRDGRLWVYDRSDLRGAGTPLDGTDGAQNPFFAPDGSAIGFLHPTSSTLRTVPIEGGPPTTVAEGVGRAGASWGADELIYLSMADDSTGLATVPARGGKVTPVTTLDVSRGETGHWAPHSLPNGRGVLFSVMDAGGPPEAEIAVLDLESGNVRHLVDGVAARYARSGHIVYVTSTGTLMAAPFEQDVLRLTGEAQPLFDGVMVGWRSPDLALSDTGTLMFLASSMGFRPMSEVVWVTRNGDWEPIDPGWTGQFVSPTLSSDGTHLAVGIVRGGEEHVWVKQLERGPEVQISLVGTPSYRPAWVAGQDSVAFISVRADDRHAFLGPADGTTQPRLFLEGDPAINEVHFSPDGEWVVYRTGSGSTGQGRDVYGVRMGSDEAPVALVATEFAETSPRVSPDGRWLAYVSDRTGQHEVYVRPFPNTGTMRWTVSVDGGVEPVWAHSGRELFYLSGGSLVSARVSADSVFRVENREALFSTAGFEVPDEQHARYDVSSDDQKFVMVRPLSGEGRNEVELVAIENFFRVLRERASPTH